MERFRASAYLVVRKFTEVERRAEELIGCLPASVCVFAAAQRAGKQQQADADHQRCGGGASLRRHLVVVVRCLGAKEKVGV